METLERLRSFHRTPGNGGALVRDLTDLLRPAAVQRLEQSSSDDVPWPRYATYLPPEWKVWMRDVLMIEQKGATSPTCFSHRIFE